MTGIFNATPLTAGDKNTLFISDNHFYYPTTSDPMPATKCYFTLLGDAVQANAIGLDFESDAADGIIEMQVAGNEPSSCYNLQGMKVEHPTHGVYIVNGRKVVFK